MSKRPFAAIILAAGKGTRMKSALPKVLHPVGGRPMVDHVLAAIAPHTPERTVLVVGSGADQLRRHVQGAEFVEQEPQLGTGHAVQMTTPLLADFAGDVVIVYGDVPLVSAATIGKMLAARSGPMLPAIVVLGFKASDPTGYGRIVADEAGTIVKMVEHKDANAAERAIDLCNSGLMVVAAEHLFRLLALVDNDNAQSEYYLPDIVKFAAAEGLQSVVIVTDEDEVAGVNSRADLAAAEARFQSRRRAELQAAGVTMIDPSSVFLSYDTEIARDVLIEPHVVLGPGVTIGEGAIIHAFSHLAGASVGAGCSVGPFARLRPGAVLEEGAKVGNFVEVKQAVLEAGAKVNHLSYIGDAQVGAGANVGAGTITCNYDGFFKYRTEIGKGAFIGSNSALVAPVKIGDGAYVGAGSVVTKDVAADALGVVRAEQREISGWGARFRAKQAGKKSDKKG